MLSQVMLLLFNITKPKVVFGDIASGDQFISSLKKIKKLNKLIPTATCVEMEGASVLRCVLNTDCLFQ